MAHVEREVIKAVGWYIIVIWGLTIGAGALVGDHKGRFGEGIAWTACLGLIGLAVIAMRSPTDATRIRQVQERMRIEEAARAALNQEGSTF